MRLLDVMVNDLTLMARDRRSLLFIVVMPVLFTLFMGLAYRTPTRSAAADVRLALAVVDPEPDQPLNRALWDRLNASPALRPVAQAADAARTALAQNQVAGVLVIPAGFSDLARRGIPPQLTLIAAADSTEGQSLYQLLRSPVTQLFSAVELARMSAADLARPEDYAPAFDLAWARWQAVDSAAWIQTERVVAAAPTDWTGGNPYNQASPGILVQFAIFGLVTSAQMLVQERKTRTLQRLLTTAMRPWEMVAGHLLAMFALTFLQSLLLILFGQLALHVNYARVLGGTLLVAAALGVWVAAVGLLIGVLARDEQQVTLFSLLAMFVFSALGGTWFPLEATGGSFAALARWMPSAWAMAGYQNVLIRGQGLTSTLLPAVVLGAYALAFFGAAVAMFRKAAE